MTTIIHIDLEALDKRLADGDLWDTGWGVPTDPTQPTCLHGAIRHCQPVPGDAYLIEKVSARFGFGIGDNDEAENWQEIRAKVIPDITDDMLADTFGPQWEPIVALVRRVATLTADEARDVAVARVATRDAAWDDARASAWGVAWDAKRDVAGTAVWDVIWVVAPYAAGNAAGDAARALVIRDLIGQHGFTQAHYDILTSPWRKVIGPVHPDDAPLEEA